MKRIIKLLLSITLLLTLCGCGSKTTISNKTEWEKLFAPEQYTNVKVVQTVEDSLYEGVVQEIEFMRDGDLSSIKVSYDGYTNEGMFGVIKDANQIEFVTKVDENRYSFEVEDFDETSSAIDVYNEQCYSYVIGQDYSEYYDDIQYSEENKSYSFTYSLNENQDINVEVYPLNGKLDKMIISYESGYSSVTITNTYSDYNKVKLSLPNMNNEINSEEQWRALFDKDKYKNCTVIMSLPGIQIETKIDGDTIYQNIYDYLNSESYYAYIYRSEDPSKEDMIITDPNGATTEVENVFSTDTDLTCFDDHYIADVIGHDYSDYYNQVQKNNNFYEIVLNNDSYTETIRFFISDGYIVSVYDIYLYNDENNSKTQIIRNIYDIGTTTIE